MRGPLTADELALAPPAHQGPVPDLAAMVATLRARVEHHAELAYTGGWPPPPPRLQWVGPLTRADLDEAVVEAGLASLRRYHPALYREVMTDIGEDIQGE